MSMGLGIGSFLEGLSKGASLRRSMDSQALDEERLQLARESAAREAEKFALEKEDRLTRNKEHGEDRERLLKEHEADRARSDTEFGWKETDRKRADEKYTADKPVIDAQRSGNLKKIQLETSDLEKEKEEKDFTSKTGSEAKKGYDAEKSKSILKNADGSFTVDGRQVASEGEANKLYEQTHGTFADRYNELVAPKMRDFYLSRGEKDKADGWVKWSSDARTKKGMDIGGKLLQSYQAGDWDGINKHFNELTKNNDYMATDGYEIKSEPIVKDGKTVGLRGIYKNRESGESFTKEYRDMGELTETIAGITNPSVIFEQNIARLKAAQEGRAKAAEKGLEAGYEVMKKNAEVKVTADENAKNEIVKQQTERLLLDPTFRKLPPKEQARQLYELRDAMSNKPAAPAAAPPAAPAAAPPPKPSVPLF